jgi:hypothetical protein
MFVVGNLESFQTNFSVHGMNTRSKTHLHWPLANLATRYELDGPGIESWWGQDFQHLPRLALGPTQPPVQRVPGHSWG